MLAESVAAPAGSTNRHAESAGAPAATGAEHADSTTAHVVVALDTLVGGVHFPHGTPAFDIGWKALAVNLSDIAAMGADATEAVAVVSVPRRHDTAWFEAFRAGFESLAGCFEIEIAALDAVPGPLSASVQVHGHCPAGEALTRSGARAGDRIFVSGTLGDAGGGLDVELARRGDRRGRHGIAQECLGTGHADALVARLRRPSPRLGLGVALRGLASAAIDVSDGLCQDLGHVLEASGVGGRVDAGLLPLSPALLGVAGDAGARALALSAGDDYELLFTVAPDRVSRLRALELADTLTEIGVIESEPGLRVVDTDGSVLPAPAGFRHFAVQ